MKQQKASRWLEMQQKRRLDNTQVQLSMQLSTLPSFVVRLLQVSLGCSTLFLKHESTLAQAVCSTSSTDYIESHHIRPLCANISKLALLYLFSSVHINSNFSQTFSSHALRGLLFANDFLSQNCKHVHVFKNSLQVWFDVWKDLSRFIITLRITGISFWSGDYIY